MVEVAEVVAAEEVPAGYRMTELGPLPYDWTVQRLGELATVRYGKAKPPSLGAVPVVGSGGVYASVGESLTKDPTIVVGRKGTAGVAYLLNEPCWPSDTTFYLDWRSCDIVPEFLYAWLTLHPPSGKEAQTTLPSIQKPVLENMLLPLPPLSEQRAIAQVLSTIQQAREATEAVIAATCELKRSLMRHLFTYGPVPVGEVAGVRLKETEIGLVPEEWDVTSLGTVTRIERGKFAHRPRNDPAFYGGDVPFIQTGDVASCNGHIRTYSQTLNDKGLSVSRVFPIGTVVITIAANIGYSGILDFDSAFPDSLIAISPQEPVDREYLNYYLITQRDSMDRQAPRGTQKNINIQFLAPWPTLVPSPLEQAAIVRTLKGVDARLAAQESRVHALDATFHTLLHYLLTGRVRIAAALQKKQSGAAS